MWKVIGAGAVVLCIVFAGATNHAPAVSSLAAALLVVLGSVAATLSGAPVGKRGEYAGHGVVYGLALLGASMLLYIAGGVLWGFPH